MTVKMTVLLKSRHRNIKRVTGVDEDFLKVERGEAGGEDSERGDESC